VKYQRLRDGEITTADDPERGVWYSLRCGYWTDDWSKLKAVGPGIPVCPVCRCPGMRMTAADWAKGVADYAKDHPEYEHEINLKRERCDQS
jgi:hypothetical protein